MAPEAPRGRGQERGARAGLERLAAGDFAALPRGGARLVSLALLAEVCATLTERRHAATLSRLLSPFAARPVMTIGATVCLGAAARYLVLLATTPERWEEAEQHFQAADALHRRLGARTFLAQTCCEHGRMLLARGRPGDGERAAQLIAQARGLAEELGMAPMAQAAAEFALPQPQACSASGDGDRRRARPLPDRLTQREAEVLGLIASGLTAKAVAAEVVISVDTVYRHIANLYAKIGARGRADATAYAIAHDLVTRRSS